MAMRRGRLADLDGDTELQSVEGEVMTTRIGADGPYYYNGAPRNVIGFWWLVTWAWRLAVLAIVILAMVFAILAWTQAKDKKQEVVCCSQTNKQDFALPGLCNGLLCIGISSLPISLVGGNCYALTRNLTLSSGDGIVINGQRNIDLCYNNFNILVNASVSPLLIHNSSDIRVYNAYHHSLTQLGPAVGTFPFGIRVQTNVATNSTRIYLYNPTLLNFFLGILTFTSDLTIIDPLIIANTNLTGNNPGAISANTMLNLVVKGGLISMKTISGGLTTGTGITSGGPSSSTSIEGVAIENVAVGISCPIGKNIRISNVRLTQNPLSTFPVPMLQVGGSQPTQNVIIEDVHVDCSAGIPRTDCVYLTNARSVIIDGLTLVGSVPPVPGTYTGGMLTIASQRFPGTQNFKWTAESYDLRHITIRMLDDTSIGLNIDTDIMLGNTRNTTATVRDSTIKGGLAGVMISGNAQNIVLQSVTVGDAPYGFVVTNGSKTVVMKDCDALSCCLGYWAAPGTSVVGVYESRALSCGVSYLNQGTGCEMGTGFGSEGNNRILGETNANCTLPPLPFLPQVSILDDDLEFLLACQVKLGLMFDDNGMPLF